jgi:hypothetical protein
LVNDGEFRSNVEMKDTSITKEIKIQKMEHISIFVPLPIYLLVKGTYVQKYGNGGKGVIIVYLLAP